jgi:hypothetical protein
MQPGGGIGQAGKDRLAITVANRLSNRFRW